MAVYVDFCFLSTLLGFVHAFFPAVLKVLPNNAFGVAILWSMFLGIEWMFVKVLNIRTLGMYALNIFKNAQADIPVRDPQYFYTDKNIKERENWVTMFLGVYLINEGCKQLFRWVLFQSFPPIFGIEISENIGIIFSIIAGIFSIYVGLHILHLKKWALYAAIGYFFFVTLGFFFGYDKILTWAQTQVILKETPEGRTLSPQDIKRFTQILVATVEYSGLVFAALLFVNKQRFK